MPSTDWFTEARFGMFIHWGLYSIPAGIWNGKKIKHPYSEWLQASEHIPRVAYRELTKQFNPDKFNADEWIKEAKNAGMKYFLITAKHHDGFALWPSKASTFNIADATPFTRDILGELAKTCKKYGLKLGFYYSHWQDWDGTGGDICSDHMENEEYIHPSEEEFQRYWGKKCLPQIRELIENYDPDFFWFDSWNEDSFKLITPERQDELISLIRNLSNKCLINSRIQFLAPSEKVDFISTMDNTFPEKGFVKPWETSGTLNNSWAYHALDYRWKPTRELICNLVKNAALGGNYQLNVGPMGNGLFQEAAIKRLREFGAWMRVNGESIYGTTSVPFGIQSWGRITVRPADKNRTILYLHLWEYSPGTAIYLKGVSGSDVKATVIETDQLVLVSSCPKGLVINIPEELNQNDLPVIKVDLEQYSYCGND